MRTPIPTRSSGWCSWTPSSRTSFRSIDCSSPSERFKAFSAEDENESLERISHYKVQKASQRYIGKEPAIPVTYLSSIPEGYDVNDYGVPAYNEKILGIQEAYVKRFSPGRYLRVDVPHFMEVEIPEKITSELRRVIAAADR